jgi:predicted nuclease of restriction endonuclease-like (RecB) superfamily
VNNNKDVIANKVDAVGRDSVSELFDFSKQLIVEARKKVHQTANQVLMLTYWSIGKKIAEVQGGGDRAQYGSGLLKGLGKLLTAEFGKGFTETNLKYMRQFYEAFPIRHTLCDKLSWSHYRSLIRVKDDAARIAYMNEAADNMWSVRLLNEQVGKHSLERLIANHKLDLTEPNSVAKKELEIHPQDYVLKDPLILDFLSLKHKTGYYELDVEQGIIDNLQEFLLELGKGFSFVKRQMRIDTEHRHYYIDLVFYNYILKCFVLVDLKIGTLTHQDVGQMDMYVRMFDDLKKGGDDNPTIGIILCEEKDKAEVKYSVLAENEQLFATKYMPYLPTEAELIEEIILAKKMILEGGEK